ncbi:MAG: oligosaccharide flippase family protein [Pseudomonadota bacterium]
MHAIQILRGIVGMFAVLIFASIVARMLGVPELTWAYQVLAIVPLIRCAIHLDMFRAQRRMQFSKHVMAMVLSNGAALLAAWPLLVWLGDYRVMLCAVLVQQVVFVAVSHLVSVNRYQVRWDADVTRHSLIFGVPLLINGLIMFGTLNGDQAIVGTFLGMETLGWYAVAFALTLVPITILANTLQTLLLPGLSRLRNNGVRFAAQAQSVLWLCSGTAICAGLALAAFGSHAVTLLFGERYHLAASVLPWLAAIQAIRLAKAGPAIIAISRGHTRDPLIANLPRLLMLPIAMLWLGHGGDIEVVIYCALIGEASALLTGWMLLSWRGIESLTTKREVVTHG